VHQVGDFQEQQTFGRRQLPRFQRGQHLTPDFVAHRPLPGRLSSTRPKSGSQLGDGDADFGGDQLGRLADVKQPSGEAADLGVGEVGQAGRGNACWRVVGYRWRHW
jgi:hypothetical protein